MHLQQDQICHRKGKTTIRCELIDLANNFNSEKIDRKDAPKNMICDWWCIYA